VTAAAVFSVGRQAQLSPFWTEEMPDRTTQSTNVYIALPPSGKGTGVLVIHAWWGLNGFFRGVCDQLASEGFVAAAPDLFEGQIATTIKGAKRLRAKPKKEPTYRKLIRAIEQLGHHPAVQGSSIGVIGFSMGGHWALWLSQRPELPIGATVTFYGARAGNYTSSRAVFLGHFAETDDWVSGAALKKLKKSLETGGKVAEFCVYPGTRHWFFESDRADAYNSEAAGLAWARTIKFLRRHIGA
jgi:carboxymethylenebutenolidase